MGFFILKKKPSGTDSVATPKAVSGKEWLLRGRVGLLVEESFSIGFANYWTLGRGFKMRIDEIKCEGLGDADVSEMELSVIPTGDGFDGEGFGRCHISGGIGSAVIHVPYHIARYLLEDLRQRERQTLLIWGRRAEGGQHTAIITNLEIG